MKLETIAAIIFMLIIAAIGPVGTVPLSLSILATYGLIRGIVRRRGLFKGAERAILLTVAALAIPMLAILTGLWSVTFDVSFQSLQRGAGIWLGIIALLEHWLPIAMRWSVHRKAAPILHCFVDPRQPA